VRDEHRLVLLDRARLEKGVLLGVDVAAAVARNEVAIADAGGAAVVADAEDALEVGGDDDAADLL